MCVSGGTVSSLGNRRIGERWGWDEGESGNKRIGGR